MPIAIITGASSGLGKEYFAAIIEQFPEIDEFWLIARRKERLQELAAEHKNLRIAPIPLDLTKEDSQELLRKILEDQKPDVRILINNAGFGKLGDFYGSDPQDQVGMTKLNVTALTAVTAIILPYLSDGSLILNISSIASFAPTPGMAVYCGTKSFVTAFSKALSYELRPRGIAVTAVCPGPMDTEFNSVAGIGGGTSPTFESLPKDLASKIARNSLLAAEKGKSQYTGRFFFRFYHFLSKLLPHSLLMKFTDL